MCDEDFKEIKNPAPVEREDEDFLVCLQPETETEQLNVGILKLNTFKFYKEQEGEKTVVQTAVDAGAAASGTVLNCPGGRTACYFRTQLRDDFFYTDGPVQGIGSVAMQSLSRRLTSRQTQEFSGLVAVNLYFEVEDGLDKKKIQEARQSFREHWNEQTTGVQALYISGLLVLMILICCVCAGLILWRHCCADTPGQWVRRMREGDEVHVLPPVSVNGKGMEENEETHSLDDSDVVPDEDEEESSDEDEEDVRPRGYNPRAQSNEDALVPYSGTSNTSRGRRSS